MELVDIMKKLEPPHHKGTLPDPQGPQAFSPSKNYDEETAWEILESARKGIAAVRGNCMRTNGC